MYLYISMVTESVQGMFSAEVHCSMLLEQEVKLASNSWCSSVVTLLAQNLNLLKSFYCWPVDQFFITLTNKLTPPKKLTDNFNSNLEPNCWIPTWYIHMDACGLRSIKVKKCFKTKQSYTWSEKMNAAGVPTQMQVI